MYVRNFMVIVLYIYICRTTSVQLMAPILEHGAQLIDKLNLGVEKQL